MSKTIKDIEHDMTVQVWMERCREHEELARSAIQMVAILVHKLGGEVEVTPRDVLEIQTFNLARIDRAEDGGVMTLRLERRHTN